MINLFEIIMPSLQMDNSTAMALGTAAIGTTIGLNQVVNKKLFHPSLKLKYGRTIAPIRTLCKAHDAWFISDVTIEQYGELVVVPWVIVCSQGIVLIDIFHEQGKVFGGSEDTHWHQVNESGRARRIENPIHRTSGLVKTIKYQIKMNKVPYIPVFSVLIYSPDRIELDVDDDRIGSVTDALEFIENGVFRRNQAFSTELLLEWLDPIFLSYETK